MNAQEERPPYPCKKLHELPAVSTEWQQTASCPDCEHYYCGTCINPKRTDGNAACPFDEMPLPLREVDVESNRDPLPR